jgi:hypothetical protein
MQSMEIFIVIWWVRTATQQRVAAGCDLCVDERQPESAYFKMTVCKGGLQPVTKKKRRDAQKSRCTAFILLKTRTSITRRFWS